MCQIIDHVQHHAIHVMNVQRHPLADTIGLSLKHSYKLCEISIKTMLVCLFHHLDSAGTFKNYFIIALYHGVSKFIHPGPKALGKIFF